ncbi:DUF1349 domain-containing protein [Antarctobacter heliothermus]|nr:DUF1349 domain-containing protein [Antarctobacter heliothermus]
MYDELEWRSPPPEWRVEGDRLTVITGKDTDFWNKTFYGFTRKDGHLFCREVEGDFSAEVVLHATFDTLYDQLGLMVRADDEHWLKTGLEYSDNQAQLSTVLTRDGWSDWATSVAPIEDVKAGLRIRLTRHGEVLRVQRQDRNGKWHLTRLGYLGLPSKTQVGLMCCSPERAGFRATFSDFQLGPAIPRDLHG